MWFRNILSNHLINISCGHYITEILLTRCHSILWVIKSFYQKLFTSSYFLHRSIFWNSWLYIAQSLVEAYVTLNGMHVVFSKRYMGLRLLFEIFGSYFNCNHLIQYNIFISSLCLDIHEAMLCFQCQNSKVHLKNIKINILYKPLTTIKQQSQTI